ncbi:MAG: M15 family metallopeptidase [Sulfurovum sp.]|nr:M15 family metallopeptidase [Sulfurovum sp.]
MYKFGRKSKKRMVGLHPTLAFAVCEAIKLCKVDFGVTDGVRTIARQRKLVKQGKSKTYNSYHLYGLAIDLVPYIKGNYRWDNPSAFHDIAIAMKIVIHKYNLPIEWGLNKWGWDMPHWQMTGYRKKYDIRKIDPVRFA